MTICVVRCMLHQRHAAWRSLLRSQILDLRCENAIRDALIIKYEKPQTTKTTSHNPNPQTQTQTQTQTPQTPTPNPNPNPHQHPLKTVIRVSQVSADVSMGGVIGGWGAAVAIPRAQGGGGRCE
jgi:hypothetical protein